ncbi:MAG TPA: efflux RND transporter periplasmic adaptor subunit [Patescibacteria group bacterium]|nr:efflux RND transporter periplasmic adaptor subunit [Patescibacteria group bacterium]
MKEEKKKVNTKKTSSFLWPLIILVFITVAGIFAYYNLGRFSLPADSDNMSSTPSTTASVKFVSSTITADGTVTAQNQANLNFQTAGKLTYLPFKEGDKIAAGQTIARLDTYQLQQQLQQALNNYQNQRDQFDQQQQYNQTGALQNQQNASLKTSGAALGGDPGYTVINDTVQRLMDQNQNNLNNSVIQVQLANYAMQLATLTSPISGIVKHEDVTVPGINITPATTFIVADPNSMVFRANVPAEDIYYIAQGSAVTLAIDGLPNKITGTVVKIYPSKIVLSTGEAVYQVDVASDALKKQTKLDETGTAIISTNSQNVALVPAWTVLNGKYIWIDDNGTPNLRQVTIGDIHGNQIEITGGLSPNDKIIIDPKYISSLKY